jgi:hypothetical protein
VSAPLLLDPFEHEVTLADEPRVLSFSPRGFELDLVALMRHMAFDLVGAIPRPLGKVSEELSGEGGPLRFASSFFQIGPSVLSVTTEIEEVGARHRVLELLGVTEDVRVRLNLTELQPDSLEGVSPLGLAEVDEGRSLGQVRIWGNESGLIADTRRSLGRSMASVGLESRVLDRSVREPRYKPPLAARLALDGLPHDDLKVMDILLELLKRMAVEGISRRAPRQIGAHRDRVRRKGSIVSYAYETHRAGTGVLHTRRREVEAGAERPGLVRTFLVGGLRGGARLRIRDVGGRASADFAGTAASVEAIRQVLVLSMRGHD